MSVRFNWIILAPQWEDRREWVWVGEDGKWRFWLLNNSMKKSVLLTLLPISNIFPWSLTVLSKTWACLEVVAKADHWTLETRSNEKIKPTTLNSSVDNSFHSHLQLIRYEMWMWRVVAVNENCISEFETLRNEKKDIFLNFYHQTVFAIINNK